MNLLTGTPELRPGVFFECVGVPGVIDQMLVGAARGCRFVIVGVCMEPDQIRPLLGITNEINLQFVLGYTARGIRANAVVDRRRQAGRRSVDHRQGRRRRRRRRVPRSRHAGNPREDHRGALARLMNLRDLRYLVALAEHLHFGRAAEACFVSQPTLSTQLRKLEDELKVTLIERGNRQVILTPVGAAVVAQAQRVLRDVDDLMRIAEEHRDPLGGDVRVGIIPTVAPYLLPRILPIIRREFPKVSIKLNEGQTRVILRMLGDGELDALILALPVAEDHVVQTKLYSEAFYLAVGKQHPKAGRKTVSLDDLNDEQVLLLEDGHCLRDQALDICNSHNAVENTNFRATSLETLRQMVAANIGITLMPELAVGGRGGAVRYIPFRGRPPSRDIGMVWRTTASRAELARSSGARDPESGALTTRFFWTDT